MVAVDVDEGAVEVARRNVAAAGLDVDVRPGSTDAVLPETFDVVLANILTHTVVALADDLVALLDVGGTLVVSGVGTERAAVVADALTAAGLDHVRTTPRGDWAVLVGTYGDGTRPEVIE